MRKLAYQWAQKIYKTHYFSNNKEITYNDWLYEFLKCNSSLSVRKPEATSVAQTASFNRHIVNFFFYLVTSVMDKYKFIPDRMYNNDETDITIVPKSKSKILALKGKK